MAGIAIVLDLLRKNPSFSGQTLHSYGVFSAKLAASAAAASIGATTPFAYRAFLGNTGTRVALCDAGTGFTDDYISSLKSDSTVNLEAYSSKVYFIEQKPLLSAFYWRNFALTSLRFLLLFYLPLLEPHAKMEDDDEDDEDFLQDSQEEQRVDLITPLKKSAKQICRETTVVTTRRVLERLAVHYVSQRMAWKLLKDVPRSAVRKAGRGMPTLVYIYSVTRTTFRGDFFFFLGVVFLVPLFHMYLSIISSFSIFHCLRRSKDDNTEEKVRLLGKKVYIATVRCGASLVFASIGAGIGASFLRPSTGQWIGCAIGDVAGPVIVSMCFEKVLHLEL
nr:Protein sym-1 like [Ipomoea batatas]